MSERLASGAQLWALNRAGLLAIVEEKEPIKASTASPLIATLYAERADLAAGRS